jgi:hypothetical protein
LRFPSDGPGAIARRSNDLYLGLPTVYLILDESSNTSVVRSPLAKVLSLKSQFPNLQIRVTGRPETDMKDVLGRSISRSIFLHDKESGT